ncbi:hypothetical protein TWF192_005751 [Orbilia oligospora]|uniref:Uncharacterized protein n=1 Tax=Orbilia oligospora TaxID=2813651 RepID=A0A6G1MM04_ORBOL|nr:hypothetical protein TWF191_003889 [Orbilia oligospora]KAF3263470.1 hypothetical protein TWF192_005751 [Orbilia oligospora]
MTDFEKVLRSCFSDILDAVLGELKTERQKAEEAKLKLSQANDLLQMYKSALENCDAMLREQQQVNRTLRISGTLPLANHRSHI